MIELCTNELKDIARRFPKDTPLYVVGGAVRDYLLNVDDNKRHIDIDICAAVKVVEVVKLLENTKYKIIPSSERLGTVIIKGEKTYEYTTFRTDSYPYGSGIHKPVEVTFTKSIEEDSKRRDFKCNAIYFDILNKKIIDPLNGKVDIEKKQLSTVVDPNLVLSQDGLRIMRLYRFVSTMGFEIERRTQEVATKLLNRLDEIAIERIQVELDKILLGEFSNKALTMMNQNGLIKKIFGYDLSFDVVLNMGIDVRLALVLYSTFNNSNKTDIHEHAKGWLERYKYKIKVKDRVINILDSINILKNQENIYFIHFCIQNFDIIEELGYILKDKKEMLDRTKQKIIDEKYPLCIRDLKLTGAEIQNLGYEGVEIGMMQKLLFKECIDGILKNEKEDLIRRIQR